MAIKSRQNFHQKAFRALTGKGLPAPGEGNTGDIQIRSTKSGLKLFAKYGNKWWQMGEGAVTIGGSGANEPGSRASHDSVDSGATRINRTTNNLELRGNLMLGNRSLASGPQHDLTTKSLISDRRINYTGTRTRGMTFNRADDVYINDVDLWLDTGHKLSFDGSAGLTYIAESSADVLDIYVGGDKILTLAEALRNTVTFNTNTDLHLKATTVSATGNNKIHFITQRGEDGSIAAGQDGDDLGEIKFRGYNDAGTPEIVDYASITAEISDASDGAEKADITVKAKGDITLDADGQDINFNVSGTGPRLNWNAGQGLRIYSPNDLNDMFNILVTIDHGASIIQTVDTSGSQGHLTLAPDGDLRFNSATGVYIAKNNGTEFSATDSAYAGMILGYTAIGIDAASDSYGVTASFAVTDADHKVTFVSPPSGKVEIEVTCAVIAIAKRQLYLGLSDNATYAPIHFPNTDDVTNQHHVGDIQTYDFAYNLTHKWVVEGLTAGTSYTWWLGAKAEQVGRITVHWGGNADGEYAPFIMKATALPATIHDGT